MMVRSVKYPYKRCPVNWVWDVLLNSFDKNVNWHGYLHLTGDYTLWMDSLYVYRIWFSLVTHLYLFSLHILSRPYAMFLFNLCGHILMLFFFLSTIQTLFTPGTIISKHHMVVLPLYSKLKWIRFISLHVLI